MLFLSSLTLTTRILHTLQLSALLYGRLAKPTTASPLLVLETVRSPVFQSGLTFWLALPLTFNISSGNSLSESHEFINYLFFHITTGTKFTVFSQYVTWVFFPPAYKNNCLAVLLATFTASSSFHLPPVPTPMLHIYFFVPPVLHCQSQLWLICWLLRNHSNILKFKATLKILFHKSVGWRDWAE